MNAIYEIPEIFKNLTLNEKEMVLSELISITEKERAKKNNRKNTYLEEKWEEINRLLYELSREAYIDDQIEIEEVWNICDEYIKTNRAAEESWVLREKIIHESVDNEFYDCYSVYDPIYNLATALCTNNDEYRMMADYMWNSSMYMRRIASEIYRKIGDSEKYYLYLEGTLAKEPKHYVELVRYYQENNYQKALEIAELGRNKCTSGIEELYVFLIKDALKRNDLVYRDKLLNSVKRKRQVNMNKVLELLEKEV